MAEAVAIFGLVASVVQLAQFGAALVHRINGFTSDLADTPSGFRSLRNRLPLLLEIVQTTQDWANAGLVGEDKAKTVQPLIDGCIEQIKSIDILLDKIIPPDTASIWDKRLAALKSLSKDKDVAKYVANLEQYIRDLTAYHATLGADLSGRVLTLLHDNTAKKLASLSEWLEAVDTFDDYQAALTARTEGTCDWILHRREFREWSEIDDSASFKALWIHGPAGFGKSILCANVIQHLTDNEALRVVSFFSVAENEAKRVPLTILRSWIHQLVHKDVKALDAAWEMHSRRMTQKATEPELWHLFEMIVMELANCVFVVDGLDECHSRLEGAKSHTSADMKISFLRHLLGLLSRRRARLLVVSRYIAEVQLLWSVDLTGFPGNTFSAYEISRDDVRGDLNLFSASLIHQRLPNKTPQDREDLKQEIVNKCDGMFLLVRLTEMRLSPGKNVKKLHQIISETPVGLENAYRREIQRIGALADPEDRARAVSILRWVTFAQRPLTVQELTEALIIERSDPTSEFPVDDLPDDYDDMYVTDQILRLCGSLVQLRENDQSSTLKSRTVHFVHFTAKEYMLRSECEILQGDCLENDYIARMCIKFIELDDFGEHKMSISGNLEAVKAQYPFLDYAARYWNVHVSNASEPTPELEHILCNYFDPALPTRHTLWSYASSLNWYRAWLKNEDHDSIILPSNLYYAAAFGRVEVVRYLLCQGLDINRKGGMYGQPTSSALFAAAVWNRMNVVDVLLENGAKDGIEGALFSGNIIEGMHFTGCIVAVTFWQQGDWIGLIRKLLENGANVLSTCRGSLLDKWTALHFAAQYGNTEALELFLAHNANIEAKTCGSETALHVAITNKQTAAIEVLIKRGANINARERSGFTPLEQASNMTPPDGGLLKQLLENGADVEAYDKDGWRAIHRAAFKGHVAIVKLLIEAGADPDASNNTGWRPLHHAASMGHTAVVKLLIEGSAETNALSNDGWRPLHLAAPPDHAEVVNYLHASKQKVDVPNRGGLSPLHLATHRGHRETSEELIKNGADVNLFAQEMTPLLRAAMRGHGGIVDLLLTKGADPNIQGSQGLTVLHRAVYSGRIDMVNTILIKKPAISLVDDYGRSCADWASLYDPLKMIFMHHYGNLTLTEPVVQEHRLKRIVLKELNTQLESGVRSTAIHVVGKLGKCFLFLDRSEDASICFQQLLEPAPDANPSFNHEGITCDSCLAFEKTGIAGPRFVCRVCPDIDLCLACKEKYDKDKQAVLFCQGHSFLKIPSPDWYQLAPGTVNARGESLEQWLRRTREEISSAHVAGTGGVTS